MRYSLIDINTCLKYKFNKVLCLHTTSNPIISLVECMTSGTSASLKITTMNRMKRYYNSNTTSNGVTVSPNGEGSYHVQGKASSNYYIYLFQNKYSELADPLLETNIIIEVTNDQGGEPKFIVGNTYSGSSVKYINQGVTTCYGDLSSYGYISLFLENGKTYDFNVKVWTSLPEESPNNDFYPYIEPITLSMHTYNGWGYNVEIPKKLLNSIAVITTSSETYYDFSLYYNPDYEFDYRTIAEDMDTLEIPAYVRPFSGYTTSTGISFPDYPVKGIKWSDWPTASTNILNNRGQVDFKYDITWLFDEKIAQSGSHLNYIKPEYIDNSTYYNNPSYNGFTFGSSVNSGYNRYYEWILGDPPLALAED